MMPAATIHRKERLLGTTLIGVGLLFPVAPSHAEMYKWVDAAGRTVYSQNPPTRRDFTRLDAIPEKNRVSGETVTEQRENLKQRLQDMYDRREDRELAAKKLAEQRAETRRQEANCSAATRNLKGLESLGRKRIKGSDGNYYRPTEEERQQMITTARKRIKTYCK